MSKLFEVKNYRKKPVVIEAVFLYSYTVFSDVIAWIINNGGKVFQSEEPTGRTFLVIETLEGNHRADPGDYIIRGVKGEFYPCKSDIFKMTYQEEK